MSFFTNVLMKGMATALPWIKTNWQFLAVMALLSIVAFDKYIRPDLPSSELHTQPVLVCEDPATLKPEYDLGVGKLKTVVANAVQDISPVPASVKPEDAPAWQFLKKKYGSKYDSVLRHWVEFVKEEHATGVPAELTAAQYILESNAGESWLAKNARNLYGFKAGHYDDNKGRWVYYSWVKGQQGIVWRKDDCHIKGREVPCPFVDFQSQFWSIRAKSDLTLRKFKPNAVQLAEYPGREWRAWVDRLAPATQDSKEYREKKKIPNYATSQDYHSKILKIILDWKFYLWPKIY